MKSIDAYYHMYVKYISRRKGDAVCAAVAYRSGTKIKDDYYGKVYDYTNKKGIVYTNIFLPPKAPKKFYNREVLWNAVEAAEKRINSRLAREVEIALPKKLSLDEHIKIIGGFIKDNFVKIGMCADAAIHDRGTGNPHAHILLTTRSVNHAGFVNKNRDWDKKDTLIEWRKNWAEIQNREFERKGFLERASDESYYTRGINIETTIHLGKNVISLERQGIHTQRGCRNSVIIEHNLEKEREKEREKYERIQERVNERSR